MRIFLPSVEGSTEGASQGAEPRGMPPRLIPTHEVEYPIRTSTDDSIIISLWSAATGEAVWAKPPRDACHLYAIRIRQTSRACSHTRPGDRSWPRQRHKEMLHDEAKRSVFSVCVLGSFGRLGYIAPLSKIPV